jgi:epoxyqueuosine reductase
VDTSPILERLYARYAGLGWIGKNTMLLAPRHGSYFFLAGVALNLELPEDRPEADHCGSCTRCLDACPTDAFPRARELDASRCISYLTIERKGAIPEPLREGAGDWIFGCDICQEVCPWNRFAKPGAAFGAPGEASLDLEALAALDNAAFKARFKGTPLERTKRKGLARNAALAMGNARDSRHRPALERAAQDPDPAVAEQAAWSLNRLA